MKKQFELTDDDYGILGEKTPTPYIKYAALIRAAHQAGLQSLTVQMIECADNFSMFKATAIFLNGETLETYEDYGDATPSNVTSRVTKHFIRIASTRAKGRVLRDALGVSVPTFEELQLMDDERSPRPAAPPATEEEMNSLHARIRGVFQTLALPPSVILGQFSDQPISSDVAKAQISALHIDNTTPIPDTWFIAALNASLSNFDVKKEDGDAFIKNELKSDSPYGLDRSCQEMFLRFIVGEDDIPEPTPRDEQAELI